MERWAVLNRSDSRLDGYCEHPEYDGTGFKLFRTRKAARAFIKERYGYIAKRPDLRAEPHGWLMPQAVRVSVTLKVLEAGK